MKTLFCSLSKETKIINKYRTKTDSGGLVDFTKIWL